MKSNSDQRCIGPSNRVWRSALMVCWDSKTVMGLMCSGGGERRRRKQLRERQWDLGFMMGVSGNAMPHWPSRKRVRRVGSLWSVTCPAFGFMYLFSLPAPVGFWLNGEPLWGGYSNTLKSFYRGPYTRALLHELELRQSWGSFFAICFSADHRVKICVLMIHAECETHAPQSSLCRFMISRLHCFRCSLVSIMLLFCFNFISYSGFVLLLLSFIHLSFGRICHKFLESKTLDSRLLKTHPIWQFYYTLTDTFTEICSKHNPPRSFTSCYGDRFQQHS